MELLISGVVFASILLSVVAVGSYFVPGLVEDRLSRLAATPLDSEEQAREATAGRVVPGLIDDDQSWMVRALAPLAGGAAQVGSEAFTRVRERLTMAGCRERSAPVLYLGGRVLLAILLPLLAWVSPIMNMIPGNLAILFPVVAAAVGYVAPSYWLDRRTRARQDQLERDLPAALDLMVVCIEAGLGLVQALARVGAEFKSNSPLLAEEFSLVSLETRTGKSTVDALRGLATRNGVYEINVLVSMLAQTERFGTSLVESLRVHCDTMRVARMQRAEERAAQAPLKMLFPTALILFSLVGLILGLSGVKAMEALGS